MARRGASLLNGGADMAYWALVADNVMMNVVTVADGTPGPAGYTYINGHHAAIGWGYVDGAVVPPAPSDPVADPIDLEARVAQLEAVIAALTG